MHVSGIELCHHDAVGPGRVGDGEPQNAVFNIGAQISRCKPIEALVTLLIWVAVTPVDRGVSYISIGSDYIFTLVAALMEANRVADALAGY